MRALLDGFRTLPRATTIGVGVAATPARALLALVAAAVVAVHVLKLIFVGWVGPSQWAFERERWGLVLAAVLAVLLAAGGRPASIGLIARPRQSLRTWARYTAIAAGLIAAVGIPVGLALWLGGALETSIESFDLAPTALAMEALDSIVIAPLYEELLFRVVICAALVAVFGPWPGVLASAALFALAHYHNPGPTNLIAGVAFGWAYVVSGSVVVPLAWHALGNLFVFAVTLGAGR